MYDRKEALARQRKLLGEEACENLSRRHVALFGLGGVGSWAAEALARAGIGRLTLVDFDTVSVSNLNRQLLASTETVGQKKTDAMAERIALIAPDCRVRTFDLTIGPETSPEQWEALLSGCDLMLDAIDYVPGKVALCLQARQRDLPLISAMGTGNRRDPSRVTVCDLFETSGCPLCRKMRAALRKEGIGQLTVVCSTEPPSAPADPSAGIGSLVTVTATAGLRLASEAISRLCSPCG